MNLSPEVYAEIFRQSAFISALIAGFSFAFLGVILTSSARGRVDDWTAGFAAAAAAGLIVCALGWTFSVAPTLAAGAGASGSAQFPLPGPYREVHRSLSITFILCFFLFLTSLGLSGWIRSRRLGIVSTGIAVVAAVYATWIMHFFIR
jgi:hypothetical protein